MQDSIAFTKVKKRLGSCSYRSSLLISSLSEHNSVSLSKYVGNVKSPEIMELSFDSESLPIAVRKARKVKKTQS
jgi:hypothetical protein